jgi:hypothetical protein
MLLVPPRGPTIDVSNFGGGHYWKYRQRPKGPAIDVFFNFGGGRCRTYQQHPQGGHRGKHYHYK